jgi:Zn-dependent metalloprotease
VGTIYQSTCTVIPPHMERHIAEYGDDAARKRVAATRFHTSCISRGREEALISAASKSVDPQKRRYVYDAGNGHTLPGVLVMTEQKEATEDVEAREAFDGAGAMYDFLAKVFLRNSIDDRGMRLISTVHYARNFNNAMWNGQQMVYGDGDGEFFNRFTGSKDIIGHEFAHGLTQFTAGLEYRDQPGALNEHVSDAFGMMLMQRWLAQTVTQSDWLIGGGLYTSEVNGKAIRSMKAPGTAYDDPVLGRDPQPAHMRGYVVTADDNGGVHINSGIPNHAFFLAATRLGGYSWLVVGKIWYRVLTQHLFPAAQFQDFANATVLVAGQIFGVGGQVQTAVIQAWSDVGLPVASALTRGGGGTSTLAAY